MREETVGVGALQLESGVTLPRVEQRVTMYGDPIANAGRIVLVNHALTGSSRVTDWWPRIAGSDGLFDPNECCIIGVNALGSVYGSTGPDDESFPRVTVRDIVAAQRRALDTIGIQRIWIAIGASLGGMQALQWALDAPERIDRAIVIGAHDHHTAMGIALNAVQRDALALDPERGLGLARKIAMLTYKSEALFTSRHERRPDRHGRAFYDVEGYLERQADAFTARMNAHAYTALTHAMDSFDVRADAQTARIKPNLTFVGISSDWLFRPQDVRAAASRFRRAGFDAAYLELTSDHGHDAFLAEPEALARLLRPVLA